MNETFFLFILPVGGTLLLFLLRRKPARYWWLSYLAAVGAITAVLLAAGGGGRANGELVGALLLHLLPLSLMFLVLRAGLFERQIYWILLLGPVVYFAGAAVALSLVVTLGLLQP